MGDVRCADSESDGQDPATRRTHRDDRRLKLLREHLQELQPTCPACHSGQPLTVGTIVAQDRDGDIREAVLICANDACQREHPVIDGIPIVVADLQSWTMHQFDALMWRDDLSPFTRSLLGDAAGPTHAFERERQTISAYGQVHWAESSLVDLLDAALELGGAEAMQGVWLDAGCAVGRATFELAQRTRNLAVGVDLSFGMLRIAERARRESHVRFEKRRVGLVYDICDIALPYTVTHSVSFWCCDVNNLPFTDAAFDGAVSLNVLDCVPSPAQHLVELGRVLRPGAAALLSSPYDWSPSATPVQQWLGGHSQRGPGRGSSAAELRRALSTLETGLSIEQERDDVAWRVYVNERASMDYRVHLLRLRKH